MDHRYVAAVRRADPDVTSQELADIVWLATQMSGGRVSRRGRRPPATPPTRATTSTPAFDADPPAPRQDPFAAARGQESRYEPRAADLRLPPRRFASDEPGVTTRSPAVRAIPSELAICRALSPLQRRAPSTSRTEADEESTAHWIAETGIWMPTVLPAAERWLDVALVVDDSESMAFWRRSVRELRTLLERTGAFRDVRVWRMDGDLRRANEVGLSSGVGGWRRPAEIVDPAGRRLVLVATDCVGRAWSTPGMGAALATWGAAGPTAIIQLLPQSLWRGCAPEFTAVRMRGHGPGLSNDRLTVRSRSDDGEPVRGGVPVPVLELEPRWLRPWASLVAGTAGSWVNGTVVFTDGFAESDDGGDGLTIPAPSTDPQEQVTTFRANASPTAYRLAIFLAAGAPLTLTVMRLVQGAMLPTSRPSHLVEVFLLGLLKKSGDARDERMDHFPEEIEYDFQPGVREVLLGELPRPAALQVLATVSNFVSQRLGSPLDFRALLTAGDLPESSAILSRPFAQVAYKVLRSLGGRYAEAAERLTRLADIRRAAQPKVPDSDTGVGYNDRRKNHQPGGDVRSGPAPAIDGGRGQDLLPRIMRGVPVRNPRFTGRDEQITQLHGMLLSGTERAALLPHTLHGLGGVGKTHLAIEYVYRFAGEYDLICWLPAHDLTQVRAQLVELGNAMGLPDNPNTSRGIQAVLDALRTGEVYRRWLLVFDNADKPEQLRPYLPYPTGHVLITSRNSGWSEFANPFEIDVFTRGESIALLKERAPAISEDDAGRLAERLGDLPLAIDQAGAWQAATGMPVKEYLRLFEQQFAQLTDHPAGDYPTPVGATYALTLDRLRQDAPGAAQLLDVSAFFGAEPISVDLLWDGRNAALPAPLARTLQDRIQLRRALREISRYALARVDAVRDTLTVHRLVQVVLRSRLSEEDQHQTRLAAQRILAEANPGEPDVDRHQARHRELSPHIVPANLIEAEENRPRLVVLDQVRFRWSQGDYESSRDLGERTLERWRERWGTDDLLTLLAFRHVAVALRTLGDYRRAQALAQEALDHFREVLGSDHEHTLFTADSVAWDQRINGNFLEALSLDEDNLVRFRREFGNDHPLTLKSANNYAIDLRWLGRFAEALAVDEESVRLRRGVYGDENRHTQLAISSLARDHHGLGDYAEGLRAQEGALTIQHRLLGPAHAEVLSETRNLAILLRKTGQHARARQVAEELVAGYAGRFGANDEPTLAANMTYFNALREVGQLTEALRVGERTLSRYENAFGPTHPATLACACNVAIVLRHQGSVQKALSLNESTLVSFREVLPENHPFTLCCATNMASDLAALHRHADARAMSEETLVVSRRVRGDDHPYTLACTLNTALDRHTTGAESEAEPLFAEAVAGFRARLGERHPETLAAIDRRRANCDIEPPET